MAKKSPCTAIISLPLLCSLFIDTTMAVSGTHKIPSYDIRADLQHRTDSLTILMLLGLLLLTILTVWLFKHRRFRFVHETGLSMIYGLFVGAIIRYTSDAKYMPSIPAFLDDNKTSSMEPPEYVTITFNSTNTSESAYTVMYTLKGVTNQEEPPLERAVTFSPELFFNVMLPVIIFEAGYSMKRKHFFKNLGAILMYALVGTTISAVVIGGIMFGLTRLMKDVQINLNECFVFGAYLSATDPANVETYCLVGFISFIVVSLSYALIPEFLAMTKAPLRDIYKYWKLLYDMTVLALFNDLHVDVDLYALVFGESVLNDAVAIVLSESVETYGNAHSDTFNIEAFFHAVGKFVGVFAGAFAIGTFMGVITAILTKFTKVREFPLLETALFFLMSYSTFQAAEAADLTGIVAVLFCGITQAHYTYNNLSVESKHRTKQMFELMNFLCENFVFLYIGVSIFTFETQLWNPGFIFASFLAVIVGRFFNVYPLSFLLNLGRSNKIRPNFQHMMMFSGLRGAMAFALAIRETDTTGKQLMVSATMTIVLATVILCGGFTTPMLQWLQIRVGVEENETELRHMAGDSLRNAMSSQRHYSTMANQGSTTSSQGSMPGQGIQGPRVYQGSNSPASPLLEEAPAATTGSQSSSRISEKAWLVAKWYNFDMMFMKPLLTNCRPTLIETMPKCCLPFARVFTTEEQISQGEVHIDEDSDTDMILDQGNVSMSDDFSTGGEAGGRGNTDHYTITSSRASKEPLQILEDNQVGDLGLGMSNHDQMTIFPTRVNLPGLKGDRV